MKPSWRLEKLCSSMTFTCAKRPLGECLVDTEMLQSKSCPLFLMSVVMGYPQRCAPCKLLSNHASLESVSTPIILRLIPGLYGSFHLIQSS